MTFAGYPAPGPFVARMFVALCFGFVALVAQAQSDTFTRPDTSCRCLDARDLFSRYCAAEGAVEEWNRLIAKVRKEETGKGEVIPVMSIKDELASCVNEVIRTIREDKDNVESNTAGGGTDRNCNVTINAPSACMYGVIEHHESWHRQMCKSHYRPDAEWRNTANPFAYLTGLINRMSKQSAIDYMYEERTGYMLEINYTRNKLEELAGRCESEVFVPTKSGRSFTLRPCPKPDLSERKECTRAP